MSKKYSGHQWSLLAVSVVAGLIASPCINAAGMSFSGTLISAPKCTMTEKPLDIKFGLVDVSLVEYGKYQQTVEYDPKCEDSEYANQFTVSLIMRGGVSSFNGTYLATDHDNLAIKVWDGSKVLEVNRSFFVNDPKKFPVLKAMLMKRPNASLSAGKFSATATLMIDVM